jgi:transposase
MGTTFRYADAATIFDVSEKTIRNWLDEGKLDKGAKRGNITAESVKRRLGFPV